MSCRTAAFSVRRYGARWEDLLTVWIVWIRIRNVVVAIDDVSRRNERGDGALHLRGGGSRVRGDPERGGAAHRSVVPQDLCQGRRAFSHRTSRVFAIDARVVRVVRVVRVAVDDLEKRGKRVAPKPQALRRVRTAPRAGVVQVPPAFVSFS
jgi:hypothetical protein